MSQIRIKASTRAVPGGCASVHTCELWVGGICYRTDAADHAHAVQMCFAAARALGLPVEVIE